MNEFIKEFGKDNFIVMLTIVGIIFLVLIVIVIIEKKSSKKKINEEILNIENKTLNEQNKEEIQKPTIELQEEVSIEPETEYLDDHTESSDNNTQDVYYAPNDTTQEEAKEKLEEVTKRLIDEQESNLIEHTNFEEEQEEKSIISYEELLNASHNINQRNDKLLEDEGEAAITIEELYRKHEEEQNKVEEESIKVNNPVFENETKKFRNSEVISPVFGVYSDKLKPKTVLKEIDKTIEQKDLEDEIKRTEDFLSELKKLKNKLD